MTDPLEASEVSKRLLGYSFSSISKGGVGVYSRNEALRVG